MKSLSPNLAVRNIQESVNYYQKNFDFELKMLVDSTKEDFELVFKDNKEYIWAMIQKDDVSIMLQSQESIKEDFGQFYENIGASMTFYIEDDDTEKIYERIKDNVEVIKPLFSTWYGNKEFYIKDCNGYILCFASKI